MTSTLVDTNVLLDVVEMRAQWFEWSSRMLFGARRNGEVVLNPVVYAEASLPYESETAFLKFVDDAGLLKEDLPWACGFLAAKAHVRYRERGGERNSTLPDFFIGAHAQIRSYRLLTRDAGRFRTYFPKLEIIAPDTHP